MFDLVVLGGGLMGCTVAVRLARAGMRVVLVEARSGLCTQASGVNTGHVAVMDGRTYRVPYVLRSMELWANTGEWLGFGSGYRTRAGLKLAFTEAEAAELEHSTATMREEGGELEMVGANRARELEPGLSAGVRAASWSPRDGYANPLLLADGFAAALRREGVEVRLGAPVRGVEGGPPFRVVLGAQHSSVVDGETLDARQVLVTGGVWIGEMAAMLRVELPMKCRVSQVTVTERQRPVIRTAISSASDTLSLKQVDNGTVLVGGGWQGIGGLAEGPREVVPEHVVGNLRLACSAVPALAQARVVRTWLGLEARTADNLPLNGRLPGMDGAWVLGAVHTGFALGPAMAEIMAGSIAGNREPVPMFDPGRFRQAKMEAAHGR